MSESGPLIGDVRITEKSHEIFDGTEWVELQEAMNKEFIVGPYLPIGRAAIRLPAGYFDGVYGSSGT